MPQIIQESQVLNIQFIFEVIIFCMVFKGYHKHAISLYIVLLSMSARLFYILVTCFIL